MRRPQGIPQRHIKLKLFGKSGSDFLNFVDKTKTLTTEKQIMMTPAAYASNRSSGGKKKNEMKMTSCGRERHAILYRVVW